MKLNIGLAFLLIFLALAGTAAAQVDREICLGGILFKESKGKFHAVGKKGELGPYQFRRATWEMETAADFRLACTPYAHDVAIAHFNRIVRAFDRAGVPVNEFNIAMAWNAGIEGVISGRAPEVAFRYAADVCRINDRLRAERAKRTPKFTLLAASAPAEAAFPIVSTIPWSPDRSTPALKFDLTPRPVLAMSSQALRIN